MERVNINNKNLKNIDLSFLICLGGLLLYFLIYILQGENSVITIHDVLDGSISNYKILKNAGLIFNFNNNTIVPQVMNGLPRNCFAEKCFSIISVIFYLFPMYWAYIINSCIVRLAGFIGIYLLTKNYILKNQKQASLISSLLALSFALLPFYTMYGLTTLGIPLLIYSILNILYKRNVTLSYLYIILFPFYSSLVYVGYALIVLLGIIILYFILRKDINYIKLIKIFVILTIVYIFSEVNVLNQYLFNGSFVSHRLLMGDQEHYNLVTAIYKSAIMFITGHYHSPSSHIFIIVLLFIAAPITFKSLIHERLIISSIIFLLIASVIYGLWDWNVIIILKQRVSFMRIFQFQRFFIISPVIWYLLAALIILKLIQSNFKKVNLLVYSFLFFNFMFVLNSNKELKDNVYNLIVNKKFITYREFFSEDVFKAIKQKIGLPQEKYKVVSLGIFPAVAQYNGFYTLDSYSPNYELAYKESFRKVIYKELDKSPVLKNYFDNWGSRCYIYSAELGLNFFVTNKTEVRNFGLDTEALKKLGCSYIFSAVDIENPEKINLEYIDKFNSNNSPLTIYLFKIL